MEPPIGAADHLAVDDPLQPVAILRPTDWCTLILLKNPVLQEPQFLANAQCISRLALRIGEALVRRAVVARNTELRGPPRLKMRGASMGLEFLAQVREKGFTTEFLVSRRSLNSSRTEEFGVSGHCQIFTGDLEELTPRGRISELGQCAIDRIVLHSKKWRPFPRALRELLESYKPPL